MTTTTQSSQRETAKAKLNHYIGRWSYWITRCDHLDAEYDRKLESFRRDNPKLDATTQAVEFDRSFTGKSLEASKVWAHRKAQTYASAILVLRELSQEPEIVPSFPLPRPRQG